MNLNLTYSFLKHLKKNNNRDWMTAHKEELESAKKEAFEFVGALLKSMKSIDSSFMEMKPEQCFFRIHRDVRFSKNKDPYKTNFGFILNPYGKKSFRPSFYLHLEPGGAFLAAGVFQPPPDVLALLRKEIDFNAKDFLALVSKAAFKNRVEKLWDDQKLSRVPKGFDPESKVAEYLKLKSFVATVTYSDAEAKSPDFAGKVLKDMKLLWPFLRFLDAPFN